MHRYKYIGTEEVHIPLLGLTLQPGEEFESNEEVTNGDFEKLGESEGSELDHTADAADHEDISSTSTSDDEKEE